MLFHQHKFKVERQEDAERRRKKWISLRKVSRRFFQKYRWLKGMESILTMAISVRVKKNICWFFKVCSFTLIFTSTIKIDPNKASSLFSDVCLVFAYFLFFLISTPISLSSTLALQEVAKC